VEEEPPELPFGEPRGVPFQECRGGDPVFGRYLVPAALHFLDLAAEALDLLRLFLQPGVQQFSDVHRFFSGGLQQAELLEPRADAGAADVEGAGDGGDGGLFGPGGEEVGVFEGTRRPAAAAKASGAELAGSGLVVELPGGAEGLEVLADGGCGDAEPGG